MVEIPVLPPARRDRKAAQDASGSSSATPEDTSNRWIEAWRCAQAEKEMVDTSVSSRASGPTTLPPSGTSSTSVATIAAASETVARDSTSTPEIDDVENRYVGRGSSAEDRAALANAAKKRSRSDKRRKVGVPSDSLSGQADAVANSAVEKAFHAVGTAADTIYAPARVDAQPRRALLLVEVNEVNSPAAAGGRSKESRLQRAKTKNHRGC